jgi:D-alanyl-D-alanine carboxypeptidase (penicillin-binding protein 5/6)
MMRVWLAALAVLCSGVLAAQEAPVPPAPKLAVKSHYLVDFTSDRVLAEAAADTPVPPASLTKLMTAYVVFQAITAGAIDLEDEVKVSEKAWRMSGTRMFIEVNSRVRVEDLIRGMLIQSGNDASVALAEHISGSVEAFVARMNEQAQLLGMRNSAFRNPTGLPAREHFSTARDMAILAKAIINDYPEFYGLYAEREFSYNGIRQNNRNALLWRDSGVDGMKTGHTDAAGYCIVTSATRDGMRLIAVVLGATSAKLRNDGAQALLEYGFANFETHTLYAAGALVSTARVFGGRPDTAGLGPEQDLVVTIPRGRYDALAASLEMGEELAAPLAQGALVGEIKVSFAGAPLASTPLVVLENVVPGGIWTKVRDELSLWWE